MNTGGLGSDMMKKVVIQNRSIYDMMRRYMLHLNRMRVSPVRVVEHSSTNQKNFGLIPGLVSYLSH